MSAQSIISDLGANLYDREVVESKLRKSDTIEKVGFTAQVGTIPTVFKADNEFVIWGPASVEVVDKEGDLIKASALSDALPQLLKRARLSLEHSDQLVGKILESFEVNEPVKVSVDGETFERSEFPTDVMELDGFEPALYVAGKVWDDSRQARETRRKIENGEIDSYSISGEALVTRTKVDDGDAYDQIVDMDLSAVTLCEEGMNQKAKFGMVTSDSSDKKSKTVSVEQIESVANNAISKQMPTNNSNSSSSSTGGGLDLNKVEKKFEEVRASEQDDTDDEGDTAYRHEDVENPFDREFSPAMVERMVKEIVEQVGTVYGLQKQSYSKEVKTLASEYDMSPAQVQRMLESKGDDGEMEDYEEEDEMEEGMNGYSDDEEDDEMEMADDMMDEEEEEDDEMEMADDMADDMSDDEMSDEMEDYEEDDETEEMNYSAEELERQLPTDVFDVVSEFIETSASAKSTQKSANREGEIEAAVEEVLKGKGISKSDGVESASAAMGESPEPSFEKGNSDDSASSHPALSNIYSREQ